MPKIDPEKNVGLALRPAYPPSPPPKAPKRAHRPGTSGDDSISKNGPYKNVDLVPRPEHVPKVPKRAHRSGTGGNDGNGESSKSTRKSLTLEPLFSKHQNSGNDREPRRDTRRTSLSAANDGVASRGETFSESKKGEVRREEGNVQMPAHTMNVGRRREIQPTQPSVPAPKPSYPMVNPSYPTLNPSETTIKPSYPKVVTDGPQDKHDRKNRRPSTTAESTARMGHTSSGHDKVKARRHKGYVQKPQEPRSEETRSVHKLEEAGEDQRLQEPKHVHESGEPGKMARVEKPRNVHKPQGAQEVRKVEEAMDVHKFERPRNAHKSKKSKHSHDPRERRRPEISHLNDTKRIARSLLHGTPKPEDADAPRLPTRDGRRGSFSTDGGHSVNGSSMYKSSMHNSSRGEHPPSSAKRSTSCAPDPSPRTYPDGGRTSGKTRRSSFPDESLRGRDRGRDSAPPVSLLKHTSGRDSRAAYDRPRVGAMSGGTPKRGSMESLIGIRNDVMANYLYQQATQRSLLVAAELWQGVVLKRTRGDYACCPPQMVEIEDGLYDAVLRMNVRCAMTVDTHVTQTILKSMEFAGFDYVPLPNGLRVQVVPTMHHLPSCQLHHFAAFVADIEILVVWDDDPENLLARAEDLQHKFVQLLWAQGKAKDGETDQAGSPGAVSASGLRQPLDIWNLEAAEAEKPRRTRLNSAFITSLTLLISFVCLGTGWRSLALEIKTDGKFIRLALLSTIPAQLFTCQVSISHIQSVLVMVLVPGH